jgi:hypothetical protein
MRVRKSERVKEGSAREGLTTHGSHFIVQALECGGAGLGAEQSELGRDAHQLLPFLEGKVRAENESMCQPFRGHPTASPTTRVVRTFSDRLGRSRTVLTMR